MKNLEEKINNIPVLTTEAKDIKYLLHEEGYESEKLLSIVEKNSFLRAKILKLANSGLFKFESSVDTVSRAMHLYGLHFSLAIVLFQELKYILKPNLEAFDYTSKKHDNLSEISCFLLFTWFRETDIELEEKLLLPLLFSELGRYIISEKIIEDRKKESFDKLLKEGILLEDLEEKLLDITCSNVSASILKRWNFDAETIYLVQNIDNIQLCKKHKELAILNVIKTVCNIHNPFSKGNINKALDKAGDFNLDVNSFNASIEIVLNRLKKEK